MGARHHSGPTAAFGKEFGRGPVPRLIHDHLGKIPSTMVPGPDMESEKEWGLLVTADDFGMCPERDRGILEAHRRGVVTSASLLVTGGSVASAVRAASEQGMQLGLHLNLSEGPPAAPQAHVASLLEPTRASWWPGEGEGTERLEFRGKHGIRKAAERSVSSSSSSLVRRKADGCAAQISTCSACPRPT